MQYRILAVILLLIGLALVACQSVPPTQFILVVTATPQTGAINAGTPVTALEATEEVNPDKPTPTATPDIFPTPVLAQMYVAEQPFENGSMFWLQPVDQLWVISKDSTGKNVWSIYDDEFEEGDSEFDPKIVPPSETLYQPQRGFGKLWRENPEVRKTLGWATDIEFGHITRYEYHAGGTVQNNQYIPGNNYHLIDSFWGGTYTFTEGAWTWDKTKN